MQNAIDKITLPNTFLITSKTFWPHRPLKAVGALFNPSIFQAVKSSFIRWRTPKFSATHRRNVFRLHEREQHVRHRAFVIRHTLGTLRRRASSAGPQEGSRSRICRYSGVAWNLSQRFSFSIWPTSFTAWSSNFDCSACQICRRKRM